MTKATPGDWPERPELHQPSLVTGWSQGAIMLSFIICLTIVEVAIGLGILWLALRR